MVDASRHFSRAQAVPLVKAASRTLGGATVSAAEYGAMAASAIVAPAQSPAWVKAWVEASGSDTFIVRVEGSGGMHVVLPLEVVRKGPFRVARFMGGSHAAENFPVSTVAGEITAADISRAVAAIRPDVDLVHLERMWSELHGQPNPLCRLPHSESPNVSLSVSLHGGFEALLDRASGKRKRKKHRFQARKFEAAGGFRRVTVETADEVDQILDTFFVMKADRFRKMGIPDVFGPPGVQAFFRRLFKGALGQPEPQFVLHALEVGGKVRAVTGSSRAGDRLVCEFGGIIEDEMAFASPGDYLFFENIREACEQGFDIYDFSIGDEPYKRLWCTIEMRQFDVMVPVNVRGRILGSMLRGTTSVKRTIKQNPLIWGIAKRLRRRAAAPAPAPSED